VIGNSKYKNVTPLANPGNDAKLVAAALKSAGFLVIGGGAQTDLDKPKFDELVAKFGQSIADADVALFYYSGHGLQVGGVNYLVPVSANPTRVQDLDFQMVSADVILHQMTGAGTKLNIVVLDACRNNPFGGRGLRATGGGLAEMHAPEGTLISYATQPGNVASDGDGRDSPFTLALVDSLRQPGMDLLRMFNRVGVQVKKSTSGNQQPWLASSPLEGDFFFTPLQGAPTGVTAVTVPLPPGVPTPPPAPAPATDASADTAPATEVASNDTPQPSSNETVLAAMRPIERGFHCPRDGLVSMENGSRREWKGPAFENPHVCTSSINGVGERKLYQFYDMNAAGVLLVDAALAPFFNGETDDTTVHIGPISYEWSREKAEPVEIGGKSFQTEKYVVDVDASASPSAHRGEWTLWYDRQTGLFLRSSYHSYVGPTRAEPAAWDVSAIMLKGGTAAAATVATATAAAAKSAAIAAPTAAHTAGGGAAVVTMAAASVARPAVTPPASAELPVQPVVARPAGPPSPGFHCPATGTLTASNGDVTVWQGIATGQPHMCVLRTSDGRTEYKMFGFYYGIGGDDIRMIDDALSGFFLGSADEATLVLKGQRYTWHRVGRDKVMNHGEAVDVAVLEVDTQEEGSFLGFHHRGAWKILYDARDGLLLRGSYSTLLGDRKLEQKDWEVSTFNPAGS